MPPHTVFSVPCFKIPPIFAILVCATAILSCGAAAPGPDSAPPDGRPNIVLILADDQGFGDAGFQGNQELNTPHLDRLSREGTRFSDFYVSPVCAPTRASLLTGRYHQRTGVLGVIEGREFMVEDEVTVAESLSAVGYATGLIGKWHLGENYPWVPHAQGFAEFVGFRDGSSPYFDALLERNGDPLPTAGYLTDVLTDHAIDFVERRRDGPFFLYLSYNSPHSPLEVPERYLKPYSHLDKRTALVYGMTASLDENVGRILSRLDELGLRENTLVIFMSDNGPIFKGGQIPKATRYNAGLRGAKYDVWEGGVRVPFVVRWPGRVPANRTVSTPAAHVDLLPTILDYAETANPVGVTLDGITLRSAFEGGIVTSEPRTIFMHYAGERRENYAPARPYPGGMARHGRYKMVDGVHLYDLQADRAEQHNIAAEHPIILRDLDRAYREWWRNVTGGRQPYPRVPFGYPQENPAWLQPHWALLEGEVGFRYGPRHAPLTRGVGVHGDRIGSWGTASRATWHLEAYAAGRYEISLRARTLGDGEHTRVKVQLGVAELDCHVSTVDVARDAWAMVKVGTVDLEANGAINMVLTTPDGGGELEVAAVSLNRLQGE